VFTAPTTGPSGPPQDCNSACLEGHLHNVAQRLGGVLEPRGDPPSLQLPGGVALPLASAGARLFADELAALHGAARARLQARRGRVQATSGGEDEEDATGTQQQQQQRQQQQQAAVQQPDDVVVYHSTFVGLQAIKAAGGEGADADLAVAADALAGVLREVAAEVERAHGSDVVYQFVLLGDAAGADAEAAGQERRVGAAGPLAAWKREARRRLLDGGWIAGGLAKARLTGAQEPPKQ
jgi:hypothetical protein